MSRPTGETVHVILVLKSDISFNNSQFAYNEMSFMLIRLLQNFSAIHIDFNAQRPETRPPASWAQEGSGRKSVEQIWPKIHLTMYEHVRFLCL